MSDIALKALAIASKLIEDRIRQQVLFDLRHSDVTGQNFRDFFIRTLEDIKEKLDGLARVDLLASLNFFKDGITLLNGYLDTVPIEELPQDNKDIETFSTSLVKGLAVLGFGKSPEPSWTGSRKEAEEVDNSFITEAKDKFDKSIECAVKAISNDALKINDRIFAARLRIIGTILKHIDDTPIALTLIKSYVNQLNSIPEIVNNAKVHFGKGAGVALRKKLNSDERNELIWCTVSINRMVWNYAHLCQADGSFYNDWPLLNIDAGEQIHPVLDAAVRQMYNWVLDDKQSKLSCPEGVVVTTDGYFVVADTQNECLKVYSTGGNYMSSCSLPQLASQESTTKEGDQTDHDINQEMTFKPRCVAVNKDFSIFAASSRGRKQDDPIPAEIFLFNSEGNFEKTFGKEIFTPTSILTSMVIDAINNRLLVCDDDANSIHVFSLQGEYLSRIGEWEDHEDYSHLAVTQNGHILVTHWDHVRIYDSDGKFASKCKPGYGTPIGGIAYDAARQQVYILCKAYKHLDKSSCKPNLQVFDKEWELQGMIELPKSYRSSKGIAITPNGFAAVVNVDDNEVIVI